MGIDVGVGAGVGVRDGSGVDVGVHSGFGVDVGDGVTVGISVASTTVFHKGMGVVADRYACVSLFSGVQANAVSSDTKSKPTALDAPVKRFAPIIFCCLTSTEWLGLMSASVALTTRITSAIDRHRCLRCRCYGPTYPQFW